MQTPIDYLGNISGAEVYVKRDDLNHKIIQGNKWRKLKYNFDALLDQQCSSVITFGGAYSNHLLAVAAKAHESGVTSVGIVRGEELADERLWSDTLNASHKYGMHFHFVTRASYRLKKKDAAINAIINSYNQDKNRAYILPEGGSNNLAAKGMAEVIEECVEQLPNFDYIFAAVGTGGSLSGLIQGIANTEISAEAIGIPVLKGADFLVEDIKALAPMHAQVKWQLLLDYHFGGYAKYNQELLDFIKQFEKDNTSEEGGNNKNAILLEQVYTGKLFYAVFDLLKQSVWERRLQGKKIIIYHSGGLQGRMRFV